MGRPPTTSESVGRGYTTALGTLGDVTDPYVNAWNQALGQQQATAQQALGEVNSGRGAGALAVNRSVAQAQQGMAAQAVGRGSNPANERAAAFGAGNMASAGIGQAAEISAQERMAALQGVQQSQQFSAQGLAGQAGFEQQQQQAAWQHAMDVANLKAQRDAAQSQAVGQAIGGVSGAVGGAAMLSDERAKTAIHHLKSGDADAALDALQSGLASDDAKTSAAIRDNIPHVDGSPRAPSLDRYLDVMPTAAERSVPATGYHSPRAAQLESELGALGDRTSAELRANIPSVPLGESAPPAAPDKVDLLRQQLRALGDRTASQLSAAVPR